MLTIIQTWTCALCGKCETIRAERLINGMRVNDFPTPNGWWWVNQHTLACPDHVLTILSKAQPEKGSE